ncbi:MAG: hypothetical protein MUE42_00405 [Opitutaceae bacterium]|jgi:hypothetical protein|nr:hypothetical protein [Opitutaceae bacterium]
MPLPAATAADPWHWLGALAALVLLLVAGHLATRALPSPCRPATAFVTGLLILFFAGLACDAFGVAIGFAPLGLALAAAAAAGLLWSRLRGAPPLRPPTLPTLSLRSLPRELWWVLPCAAAFASVVLRGVLDPLAGWDNLWRWDHLARLMAETGRLDFYPPRSDADFALYPWCDGIPPLTSVSNLWIYLAAGSTSGPLISIRLAAELALSGVLVWRIARDLHGPLGARLAVLALAGSSLFLASVSIAQETGLSGLALLLLAHALLAHRRDPTLANALWCAVAASFAALCRDYNLLFPVIALGLLATARPPRAHLVAAAAAMIALVVPWYARNWLLTGNPLFAHDVLGLFPVPAYHDYLMGEIRRFWQPSVVPDFAGVLAGTLGVGAGALVLLAATASAFRGRAVLLALVAGQVALWALSVSSTAGGVVYSLRVLGPALPLLAILTGAWALRPDRWRALITAVLVLCAADSVRRHWIFFTHPLSAPLPYSWSLWTPTDAVHQRFSRLELWRALAASSAGELIAVDNPSYPALGRSLNLPLVPLFSPALQPLAEPSPATNLGTIVRALRAAGVRFVVLGEDTTFGRELHSRHPGIGLLYATPPVGRFEGLRIYDLRLVPTPELPALGATLPRRD